MCGIAGIVGYRDHAALVERAELRAVREAMVNRGPDGLGEWISPDGRSGLAHRRLAIIDPSDSGRQPMSSADGRFHVTFNGEIYNYRELRAELATRGYRFVSESDTEVLLYLFQDRGASMVHALRGMFAFAIWDELEKTLFLARDPFGIKPLYYSDDGRTLRFASQVKALMVGGAVASDPDPAGHVGFFLLGSVPEPFTVYRAVRALASGHTMRVRRGSSPVIERYFDIADELATAEAADAAHADWHDRLGSALRDSVRAHMVSDVPVGLFLSSGLDSSIVAALAAESAGERLRSVTLGFQEYRGTPEDEVPLAAATAHHLGTSHTAKWIRRETFEAELDRLLGAMDQPSIDGVNTYFVSKAAAEAGMKVALSGLGGDELFAGYPSFRQIPRMVRTLRRAQYAPRLARTLRRLAAPLMKGFMSPKFASLFEFGGSYTGAYFLRRALYMGWELRDFMQPSFVRQGCDELDLEARLEESIAGVKGSRQRVAALEMAWYMRNQLLRDADWAGMAHSVEIRVPLVDVQLLRAVAPMLGSAGPTKVDAARSLATPLPPTLLDRRKTGFSIPVHEWAKRTQIARGPRRKLRNWAHIAYLPYKPLAAVTFLSDAFGGHGGIALFNRDFLTSVCAMPRVSAVDAFPRIIRNPLEEMPAKLNYHVEAADGKLGYVAAVTRFLVRTPNVDIVLCGHINLLPLAVVAKKRWRVPLLTFIHGIDAWTPRSGLHTRLLPQVDRFVAVSEVTRARFGDWSRVGADRIAILPNAVHPEWYGPGARRDELLKRYGIENKRVLMTLGRLVSSERYKGFDEVLEALPSLLTEFPDIMYIIGGDGTDRERLENKAKTLGVADSVRFTGFIREAEKADHYRLADVYVMPSRGEGFGIVFLEAMACGVPAVASAADGGREALRGGRLGILVDPASPEDIKRGIREALNRGRGAPPPGLEFFNFDNFKARTDQLISDAVRGRIVAGHD